MRPTYIGRSHGCIIVFDITSRKSFTGAGYDYDEVMRTHDDEKFPVIFVGNKCDLEHEREVEKEEAQNYANSLGCTYIETSALARINVDEALHALLHEIPQTTEREMIPKEEKHAHCCLM
uniref:Uncharacterized protein n=1 Tax=Vannella robusta TaxID=1487602 RepID=A0A7S4IKZ2_9EUKA|mmetsp:Transcript_4156/g.5149  ORF Transcript_4156/g.5149 Transcript_4156/m.5149 type:complete len:120 (+) Transcript_4156:143-502(+)